MISKNKYGFYELTNKPSEEELKEYYKRKYFQEGKGTYQLVYSEEELRYILNKIEQKYYAFKELLPSKEKYNLLDIGCGEGFCLKYFKEKGWDILGCDYSDFGIKAHNPEYVNDVLSGDVNEHLTMLASEKKRFDVIWLDNVLEHVLNPLHLLQLCKRLIYDTGLLIIEVPNDFSELQQKLYEHKMINCRYWIAVPDHISYFNKEGLINICNEAGWFHQTILSDFPIDFNLSNPHSNYVENKTTGRGAHQQRVFLDNLFHGISIEGTNKLYQALADMGLGRQVIGVFNCNQTSEI